jgi:Methyltransferase domain
LPDLAGRPRILDLACGPGSWVFDAAKAYPHHRVVGVDDVPLMISIAQEQSLAAGSGGMPVASVAFHLVPELAALPFPEGAFDFIHGRLLAPRLWRDTWHRLLAECLRLLAPGGVAQLTEWELPVTSGPACERFFELIAQAYQRAGKTLSGGARALGISAALPHLARSAGFSPVHCQATPLDFSADSPDHADVVQNAVVALRHIQPFLLAVGQASSAEIEQLYQQVVAEMRGRDFTGGLVALTVRGIKPGG